MIPRCVIGVDLGGTNLRLGLVDASGRIRRRAFYPLRQEGDPLRTLYRAVREMAESSGRSAPRPAAVGAAVPGVIDVRRGIVTESPNYPSWKNLPLRSRLSSRVPLPIILENDANAFAWGEGWKGAARSYSTYIGVTMGTGVGGGIVVGGELVRGADGMAGEIGHVTVDPGGPPCNCGGRGCLEVYASATGMIRMAREAMGKGVRTSLSRPVRGTVSDLTPQAMSREARRGDRLSRRIFETAGSSLGIVLADVINLLNPEAIILGGGVARAYRLFAPAMKREIAARAYDAPRKRVNILLSGLGEDAGILGAARIGFEHLP